MPQIEDVKVLPSREKESYKNNFGRVLIIGGSVGMSGAAEMSGSAALRSGAGLVEVAVPKSIWPIVAGANPACMVRPVSESKGVLSSDAIFELKDSVERADVVAFGPGVGSGQGVRDILAWLMSVRGLKLVVDADGLNSLAKMKHWKEHCEAELIVTPHPGEMKRLWGGVFRDSQPGDRIECANKYASETGCVVVLKGAWTVVSDGADYYVNNTGNPGMATAGSGDVLTGMIAAFWGQLAECEGEVDPAFHAAALGVKTHGSAGDYAAETLGEVGLTALDIIESIPDVTVSW